MSSRELLTIADRVKWAIEQVQANGVTLEALAEQVGCSHVTMSNWKNGKVSLENAKLGLIDAFSKATGVSIQWLLHGGPTRVDSYTTSEHISNMVQKLRVMEKLDPDALSIVERVIDAATPPTPPERRQ